MEPIGQAIENLLKLLRSGEKNKLLFQNSASLFRRSVDIQCDWI